MAMQYVTARMRKAIAGPLPPRLRTAVWGGLSVFPHAAPWRVGYRIYTRPRRRILCHPGRPSGDQILFKLCAWNGYEIVRSPTDDYDLAFHFCRGGACGLPPDRRVLNRACEDISKRHVAAVFAQTFGYGLSVDPTTYDGELVCKSNANATHDGAVLRGPLPARALDPSRVYQRLVRAEERDEAIDLRTPIYAGQVPLVYEKRRPLARRFAAKNTSVRVREAEEVYTTEELALLGRFAQAMGLDFGELDVLRDRQDGRIYVVDVANTPGGPPFNIPPAEAGKAMRRLGAAFHALVENARAERGLAR